MHIIVTLSLALTSVVPSAWAAANTSATQDQDLTKKLIRQTTGQEEADLMTRIIQAMEQCAQRLSVDFDASDQTRAVQEQIVKDLDDAIKTAANATHRKPNPSSSSSTDKRSASRPQQKPEKGEQKPGPTNPGRAVDQPADQDTPASTDSASSSPPREMKDRRRSWGNLPARDRDEVIEGMDEAVMPRFREWIERYYRALQSSGKEDEE